MNNGKLNSLVNYIHYMYLLCVTDGLVTDDH